MRLNFKERVKSMKKIIAVLLLLALSIPLTANCVFADEISPAVTVLRFSYVCADAASGTQDLVFDMSPVVNIITHFDKQNGKLQAQFCQCAFHVDMIAFFIEFSRIYHTRYRS